MRNRLMLLGTLSIGVLTFTLEILFQGFQLINLGLNRFWIHD